MTPAAYSQVGELMETYFEGLYQADSALLRRVFHARLAYVCATEDDELYLDLDTYLARVDGRVPPAKRGDARAEEILEIAFAGDRLARVSARMTMMGRVYHDMLTLIRDGAEWRVVAKVFSYIPGKV